jgi:hypothetical protein
MLKSEVMASSRDSSVLTSGATFFTSSLISWATFSRLKGSLAAPEMYLTKECSRPSIGTLRSKSLSHCGKK